MTAPLATTWTLRLVNPLDLQPDDIFLIDVAMGLAHINRYNGAGGRYSVAEHCCHVHDVMVWTYPEAAAAALMHDAGEAYLGDIHRPVKDRLPDIAALSDEVQSRVEGAFGIEATSAVRSRIAALDRAIVRDEMVELFGARHAIRAGAPDKGVGITIRKWRPLEAAAQFMRRATQAGIPMEPRRLASRTGERR